MVTISKIRIASPEFIREFQIPAVFGISIETVKNWGIPAFKPSRRIKLYPIEAIRERISQGAIRPLTSSRIVIRQRVFGQKLGRISG